MTAPVRIDPTTVEVSLGDRSYDIVIGRGVLASLGTRVAALRPGAKTVIITDENVARYHLTCRRNSAGARRSGDEPRRRSSRRGVEKLSRLRAGLRSHHRVAD